MPRIQVYTDPEMKRRIELAAARWNVAVTHYCLEAIQERLEEEEMLEKERIEIPVKPEQNEDLLADLRALREKVLIRREGRPITRDVLNELREERDHELGGLP
jgi:hypothetical protein